RADRDAVGEGGRDQVSAGVLTAIRMVSGVALARPIATGGAPGEFVPRAAPHVTIRGLTKRFADALVYDRFDLDIPRGKLVSIFGPNGWGKSTLINMIAGLIPVDAGEILFDGKPLRDIRFGYVFQNYREALFPWLRAVDNIEYPLKLRQVPKRERRAQV